MLQVIKAKKKSLIDRFLKIQNLKFIKKDIFLIV